MFSLRDKFRISLLPSLSVLVAGAISRSEHVFCSLSDYYWDMHKQYDTIKQLQAHTTCQHMTKLRPLSYMDQRCCKHGVMHYIII